MREGEHDAQSATVNSELTNRELLISFFTTPHQCGTKTSPSASLLVEMVLDEAIDAAAARAAAKAGAQLGQVIGLAGGNHFHVAVFGVAHPAAQVELAGLALHKPAEADALHAALNEEMKNHAI